MSSLAPSAWFLLLVHFIPCSRSESSELLNPRAVSTAPTGPWVIVLQALQVQIRVERAGMFCCGRDSCPSSLAFKLLVRDSWFFPPRRGVQDQAPAEP